MKDVLDLHIRCPVLAVLGRKASGKTTIIEYLVSELVKKGFYVATIKHIAHKGFSIDKKGSDTWRHLEAGANPVAAFSEGEISIIIKTENPSLEVVSGFILGLGANILILEGFSSTVLNGESVGKIICVRSREEYEEFKGLTKGDVIAFCSFQHLGEPILRIGEDIKTLTERTLNFIEKKTKILEILSSLAGLDCGKCNRETCEKLAEEIYNGTAILEDCVPLKIKPKLNAKITINGSEVPLQQFVSEFVRKTLLGMISSLKNVNIKGNERVYIEILK
ncbi:MAG: molybdopterin-guanine dinucleotide biosynthesis protein B [Candidatus Bathyarchaeia archaeon]